eukprot:jgi/Chrpa1/21512/Chrysochromulina_OHIO_Genome00009902-RA
MPVDEVLRVGHLQCIGTTCEQACRQPRPAVLAYNLPLGTRHACKEAKPHDVVHRCHEAEAIHPSRSLRRKLLRAMERSTPLVYLR